VIRFFNAKPAEIAKASKVAADRAAVAVAGVGDSRPIIACFSDLRVSVGSQCWKYF
jgi:hypothetical protein